MCTGRVGTPVCSTRDQRTRPVAASTSYKVHRISSVSRTRSVRLIVPPVPRPR